MRREINILFNALLFYSRIRVPRSVVCNEQTLSEAYRYFPLVGIIVGAMGAALLWLSSLVLPPSVSIVMAMAVIMLSTGGFHEDGLADFADGFGAGRDKESILRIMKDSHIGTYGVLTLIAALLLKFCLIESLGGLQDTAIAIIAVQGASRFAAVAMLAATPYVRGERSKATHASLGVSPATIAIAAIIGIAPMFLLGWVAMVASVAVGAIAILLLRSYSLRRIGGCTGDVLGAAQQICELLLYITIIAVGSL